LLGRRVARFNKQVTNRLQGTWAPYVPPYAVVIHEGRKSGRTYRTPVVAFMGGGQVAIPLPYGDRADWVSNLLAAGGGSLVRGGRKLRLGDPHVVDARRPGVDRLPRLARAAGLVAGRVLLADVQQVGDSTRRSLQGG
jgi:deazaflavin-dependent oxidoreductase (nitroreductase family)